MYTVGSSGEVLLASSVSDLSALQMQISTTGSFAGAAWEPYNPNRTVDLPSGASTLAVRVRDEAGVAILTDVHATEQVQAAARVGLGRPEPPRARGRAG